MKTIILAFLALCSASLVAGKTLRVDLLSDGQPTGEFAVIALQPGAGKFGEEKEFVVSQTRSGERVIDEKKEVMQVSGFSWNIAVREGGGMIVKIVRHRKVGEHSIAGMALGMALPSLNIETIQFTVSQSGEAEGSVPDSKTLRIAVE